MNPDRPPAPAAIPKGLRTAAILVTMLTSIVGLAAAMQAFDLWQLDRDRQVLLDNPPSSSLIDPEVYRLLVDTQSSALEGMRGPRVAVLLVLWIACTVAFVSALRLLRPDGLPRESVRQVLGFSLITTALLRTIDGAQMTVVAKRVAEVTATRAAQLVEGAPPGVENSVVAVAVAGAILFTALIAGGFLLLGQYFHSEKVKQIVAVQDERLGH